MTDPLKFSRNSSNSYYGRNTENILGGFYMDKYELIEKEIKKMVARISKYGEAMRKIDDEVKAGRLSIDEAGENYAFMLKDIMDSFKHYKDYLLCMILDRNLKDEDRKTYFEQYKGISEMEHEIVEKYFLGP